MLVPMAAPVATLPVTPALVACTFARVAAPLARLTIAFAGLSVFWRAWLPCWKARRRRWPFSLPRLAGRPRDGWSRPLNSCGALSADYAREGARLSVLVPLLFKSSEGWFCLLFQVPVP